MINSQTIYKYRTWSDSNHRYCLKNNEFYFASSSDMNDPFDSTITIDYSLLNSDEKIEKYVDKVLKEAGIKVDINNISFAQKRHELIYRLKTEPDVVQSELDLTSQKSINKHFGILSFSTRWDSILMWTHYSQNHKGFCVGLNKEKLIATNKLGMSGRVIYENLFPKIDPVETTMIMASIQQMNTKAYDWQYEEEFRFVNIFDNPNPTIDDRKVYFPDDFIDEIILGLNISNNDLDEIREIADQKKIPLFKIIKKTRAFLLEKEKV